MYFHALSPEWAEKYRKEKIEVRKLWKPKRYYWLLLPVTVLINVFSLKKQIKKTDVVYATGFPVNLIAVLISNKTISHCFEPLPIFYDPIRISSLPPFSRLCVIVARKLYAWLDVFAIRTSSRLTTLNVSVEKFILETYRRKPDAYIPNGVDTDFFRLKTEKIPAHFIKHPCIIGHSTDYTIFKGTPYLLRALVTLVKKTKNFKVLISESVADTGMKREYLSYIRASGLKEHVVFVGNLSDTQLVTFYKHIDVFIFTGSHQSAGGATASLSVIEAQACGTPVIRSIGNGDEIINHHTGFYIDPSNPRQIADALYRFIYMPQKTRRTLRKNTRAYVLSQFTWKHAVSALDVLISTLNSI